MTETVKLQVNNLNQAVSNNNPKTEYNEHVGLNTVKDKFCDKTNPLNESENDCDD